MRKTTFELDGIRGQFPGYTNDENWNGFDCPYFDTDTSMLILTQMFLADSLLGGWLHNPYVPCFFAAWDTEQTEVEEFDGILTEHGILYGIGAFSWCWSESERE